jgi:tetratricopeptide (TPR) repeat protein
LKDSMDAEVHFFLGASLAQAKEKELAIIHLDKSLQLMQPESSVVSRIYSEKGYIKRLEEDYELAYKLYEMSWEADTSNPLALYYMASIMDNSMHRSEEALEIYQRFIDQLDKHPTSTARNEQIPTLRDIVEDRIISIKEELFFLDND